MKFSAAQCAALFAAVLVDDDVDAHTELPARISLDFDQRQLADCFELCRQLWTTGVRRNALVKLSYALWRNGDLNSRERLAFKYARAKFKHLRFAYSLYDARHRYPLMLDWTTTAMGHLQDAFKNGKRLAVLREAALSRLLLTWGPQYLQTREIGRFRLTSSAAFKTYMLSQVAILRSALGQNQITGAQFHATRKVISRMVSFYDTLRTIEPTPERYMMSRSLAAINGLMGQMHDTLIEQRLAGAFDYFRKPFDFPDEIRMRLNALTDRFG